MPGAGFSSPWVLFLGSLWPAERSYVREVLHRHCRDRYERLVEPAAGSFAISLMARDLGWPIDALDTSDVSLYSTAIGYVASGTDLAELKVTVDGELLELAGAAHEQAATILFTQMLHRALHRYDRNPSEYLAAMIRDFVERRPEHEEAIATRVRGVTERLTGLAYRPIDLMDHTREAMADPNAAIILNPPTVPKGYEKFFDAGDRFQWAEPTYSFFEPPESTRELLDLVADAPAFVLVLEEAEPRSSIGDSPVYARVSGKDRYTYYHANRPDELKASLGGLRVIPRAKAGSGVLDRPILPPDYELTADTVIDVQRIDGKAASYLKELWVHGIDSANSSGNFAVLLDGHIAGVGAVSHAPISNPHPGMGESSWAAGKLLLMYGFAPWHPRYPRLNRLVTRLGMARATHDLLATPASTLFFAAADGVMTVEMTRMPESKGLRGLMKLHERRKEGDRFRLMYSGPILDDDWPTCFRAWLTKENNWMAQRAEQQETVDA